MILPLSKSIFNSQYFMFGDRAGFGYLDIICRDYNALPDIRACLELLTREFSHAVFHFNRVKPDSLIYQILKNISAPKSIEECVKIDLIGRYDDYFKSLSKNARQNFRTANNRIVKASKDLSFIRVSGKDISKDNAWTHVAGLTVGQDISDRAVQFHAIPPQFNLGKSFDTFGPIGPILVSPDELDDKNALDLECSVNGELRQKDNTSDLIFDIPYIISYISEFITLSPGDLIFTGTPAGVGATQGKLLKDGDILSTTIHGIGTIENKCVRISDHTNASFVPEFVKGKMPSKDQD